MLGQAAGAALAAAALIGAAKYGLPYLGYNARVGSNFTKPNTVTGLAQAYEWARRDMGNTPAWKQFQSDPQKFINKTFLTDSDSHADHAAEVLTDMINGQPDSIYEMDIDTMKNAIRAFRNGDSDIYKIDPNSVDITPPTLPPIFNVNTTDIEQTRKDMIALNNLVYGYQNFGSPGQRRAVNGVLNGEYLPEPMVQELRKIYDTNKDKLAIGDFSGLNLPPEEVARLNEYLQSKIKKKTILNPVAAGSDKNSAKPQKIIPADSYSVALQEKLQQRRRQQKQGVNK